MKLKAVIYSIFIGLLSTSIKSSRSYFHPIFLVPESINPGFTGFLETTSAGVMHRTQWTNLQYKMDTNYAYASTWLENSNSGIGVTFLNHRENFTGYNFYKQILIMLYRIDLNYEWYFRPGIEVGYGSKSFIFKIYY